VIPFAQGSITFEPHPTADVITVTTEKGSVDVYGDVLRNYMAACVRADLIGAVQQHAKSQEDEINKLNYDKIVQGFWK
jgi:hypothetical protein